MRRGYTFDETRVVRRDAVEDGRRRGARSGELEVAEERAPTAWPASTTPRTRSTRRSSRRTACARRPVRRCRCRSSGTSSTTPTCGPTDGRSTTSSNGSTTTGDPFEALLIGIDQDAARRSDTAESISRNATLRLATRRNGYGLSMPRPVGRVRSRSGWWPSRSGSSRRSAQIDLVQPTRRADDVAHPLPQGQRGDR